MRDLTEEEMLCIVSEKVADYTKEVCMFVPLTGDQPVVMYTSLFRGIPSKHYLGLELKLKYSGGLYVYQPESKPFDMTQHEWSDVDVSFVSTNGYTINLDVNDCGINHGLYLNKDDIIAIAKHFKLTAEDLK